MGMPGPLELIIVLGILGAVVTAVAVAVVLAVSSRRGTARPPADAPNLAPCPDCGRAISMRATTCPHCGGPVTTK